MAKSVESFVGSLGRALESKATRSGSDGVSVRRKMRTVASSCGWKARSNTRIEELHGALESAGIYAFPEVTDSEVTMDTYVSFSRTDRAARSLGKIFGNERGIHLFVQKYYVDVFRGQPGLEDLELVGREYPLYSGRRKLKADLLFRTPDGAAVVFEFKRGDPTREAVAQLREYMRAALDRFDGVSGVLVTARPRTADLERLIREEIALARHDYPIEWYWYSVEVDLQPAD